MVTRTNANAPRAGGLALPILLSIALLASCASVPAPEPQRTYERVRVEQLYPVTRDVFAAAGFKTFPCRAGVVCLATSWSWREYNADGRGGTKLRERRMYSARYERLPLQAEYVLFLDLVVQERPAPDGDWVGKRVMPESDPEYLLLLAEIDRSVWRFGGREYRGPSRAAAKRAAARGK